MTAGSAAGDAIPAPIGRELLQRIEQDLIVDTSEQQEVYLLVGHNGTHIRLSPSAVQLLRHVGRGTSFERLADVLSQRGARKILPGEVESAYRSVIERIAAIEAGGDHLHGAFWFRRGILPGAIVNRIASACAAAFHPVAVALFVTAMIAALTLSLSWGLGGDAGSFWPAYGLFLASLVAHEVGHASACARYGARPSEIGVALYFIYPVFYSNVSAVWGLKRWQRVVVDIGGVYFQLIIGAAYACSYAVSGWEPLRIAILFILGSCAFSLNPILKFDGYWVVADSLGVTNLDKQPSRVLRHLFARLRGRSAPALPWSLSVTIALVVYSAVSVGFWAWFLWVISPALLSHAVDAAGVIVALVVHLAASRGWPGGEMLRDVATATYVLLLAGLIGWRLFRRLVLGRPTSPPNARATAAVSAH